MEQRDVAKNEHTMNIRAGIAVLKTMYSMHIDEYDYLDIAVDALRDIKHFGSTEYVAYITADKNGKVQLPCNMDSIDAVTTEHMGRKSYGSRVEMDIDGITGTDEYITQSNIMDSLNRVWRPGLGGLTGEGYISYQLEGKTLRVDKSYAGQKITVAYTGITTDLEGLPIITRKQANALAAISARVLTVRGANKGDKGLASMVEYYTGISGRLIQAASIPENISDNELDEVLNCMNTFNKKTYKRPTKYSR
jgi:hypothetical protein